MGYARRPAAYRATPGIINKVSRGGPRNFGKRGPGKRATPRTERRRGRGLGASPEIFEKLDAISCNLSYIFLGSEWPQISFKIGPLQNKKTVAATISKPTDIR